VDVVDLVGEVWQELGGLKYADEDEGDIVCEKRNALGGERGRRWQKACVDSSVSAPKGIVHAPALSSGAEGAR
jgi:hypothetical protein